MSYALFDNFIKVFFQKSGFSQQFILCGVIKVIIAYWIRWAKREVKKGIKLVEHDFDTDF